MQECTQRWIWNPQLPTVQLSNNKYINGILTWLDCNQRSYIWIFGWTLRKDVQLDCAQMPELFFDLHVPFQLSAKKQNKKFVQMYTGTRLTTAIHRRLLSRFFLREGGRLYTGYDFWTILVHGRFDNSSHFVHVIDTHYIWAACGETGSYINLRLSVQAPSYHLFCLLFLSTTC